MGVAAWLAQYFTISILIQTLASMIGLGLGIDYALLMVSRFREALSSGMTTAAAAEEAARRAGWTIFLSAFPVSISFAALLMIPLSEQRSDRRRGASRHVVRLGPLGDAAAGGALAPRPERRRLRIRPNRPGRAAEGSEGWRRWGHRVTSRPLLVSHRDERAASAARVAGAPAGHDDAPRATGCRGAPRPSRPTTASRTWVAPI